MTLRHLSIALAFLAGWGVCGSVVHAQAPAPQKPTSAASQVAPASVATKPTWKELTPEQQQALQPLAQLWPTLREPHKRKWIALSRNFAQRAPDEQAMLQGRMKEWAALTPQQRTFARLNYADVQKLSTDERRAKWEAYQALTQQDKQKLAQKQPKPMISAAPAIKPTPEQNRVMLPSSTTSNKTLARINTDAVAPATLLPAGKTPLTSAPKAEVTPSDNATSSQ